MGLPGSPTLVDLCGPENDDDDDDDDADEEGDDDEEGGPPRTKGLVGALAREAAGVDPAASFLSLAHRLASGVAPPMAAFAVLLLLLLLLLLPIFCM